MKTHEVLAAIQKLGLEKEVVMNADEDGYHSIDSVTLVTLEDGTEAISINKSE